MGGTMPLEVAEGELERPSLTDMPVPRDGRITPPTGPGLGVELDGETLRRYPYQPGASKPFLLR
jgi:L-alanine-DL-glutamate epimerase-like enolase superfamily enzyme